LWRTRQLYWMLDALRSRRNALRVAIDPYQKNSFKGIGLKQVERLAFPVRFEWIEDVSMHALSGLIRQSEKFDLIFMDGNHRLMASSLIFIYRIRSCGQVASSPSMTCE
jgi:hypothetical protein